MPSSGNFRLHFTFSKVDLMKKETFYDVGYQDDEVRKDLHAAHELCPSYSSFFVELQVTFC